MSQLMWVAVDGYNVAKRNLIKIKRVPEILIWVLMSPIMFVLLFAYVFGGAIDVPGVSYREFLIAGIFAQTVVFGATYTGAGLAEDMKKGIIDRFRSLPMTRSAVLIGRTGSDIIYNVLSITIMALTGLLVGWRIRTSFWEAAAGFALVAPLLLCPLMGHGSDRIDGAQPRGGQQRLVHGHHAPDLRLECLRAQREPARPAAGFRRVEPGVGGDAGSPEPLRQRQPVGNSE